METINRDDRWNYFFSDRSDHMETINRDDRWNYFSAIATIVAISAIASIIWKPGLSDISLGGRLREVALGRLSFPEV